MKKRIFIKSPGVGEYEVFPIEGQALQMPQDNQILIEGVTLCRVEEPR